VRFHFGLVFCKLSELHTCRTATMTRMNLKLLL
jgi:hypothetical protein